MKKTVYVGLSGGVDSSVTASLLIEQGYSVVGVHMKNWSQDIGGFECPWQEDFQDAKRLAAFLGIEFKLFDFEKDYKQRVVDYMLNEFKIGRTPNPDVMCNQEIKFKLFLEASLEDGADYIATGHYARTKDGKLLTAIDDNKDQTYFLCRVEREALKKTLFPLGEMTKPEVRTYAKSKNLPNAGRKESMGICFVGKVGIREFLTEFIGEQERGDIIDDSGRVIGAHEGALFYTIGQRSGLGVGGGLPLYVTGKDMTRNEVYVTKDIGSELLWAQVFTLTSVHWIAGSAPVSRRMQVRTRHRAQLEQCEIIETKSGVVVHSDNQLRALTPGQSAVFYQDNICLGGGIISTSSHIT